MRKKTSVLAGALLLVFGISYQEGRTQSRDMLDIYSIDVEGGQSTLYVSPSGRSMLVDAGNPGDRDADRIAAVAKLAGLTAIDVMLTTHYDGDHHGGVKDVAARIPIRTFVDHGPRVTDPGQPQSPQFQAYVERTDRSYAEAVATGKHIVVKPGDTIPVEGLDIRVVASNREALKVALPGGGAPNSLCAAYEPHDFDPSENSFSVGLVIRYGTFRMLNLGDLTWNREHDLVCPNNLLGTVDLYLTTHHGLNLSGPPALVHAVKPRVAIMNNAAKKGAAAETMATLRSSPNLEDLWQLHYSVPRPPNTAYYEKAEPGGKDLNTSEQLIANLDEAPTHTPVNYLKVSVRLDGTFTVTNSRNGFSKQYRAAGSQAAAALPMPKYHHIHVNAVNPDTSLDWYANYWPAGRKTTVAGFPAFQGGDLYLLVLEGREAGARRIRQETASFDAAKRVLDVWFRGGRYGWVGRAADETRSAAIRVPPRLRESGRQDRRDSIGAGATGRPVADRESTPRARRARKECAGGAGTAARQPGFRVSRGSGRDAGRVQFRGDRSFLVAQSFLAREAAVRRQLVCRAPGHAAAIRPRPEIRRNGRSRTMGSVRRADRRSRVSELYAPGAAAHSDHECAICQRLVGRVYTSMPGRAVRARQRPTALTIARPGGGSCRDDVSGFECRDGSSQCDQRANRARSVPVRRYPGHYD